MQNTDIVSIVEGDRMVWGMQDFVFT